MNYNDYRVAVLEWRNLLVRAWSFICREGDAECARILVDDARMRGLTERQELKGATLRNMPNGNKSPEWVCKAAFYLLLENEYVPNRDETLAALVFYWLKESPVAALEDALEAFPEYLMAAAGERVKHWMGIYFDQ
jgi:hypothetical protein